MTWITEATQLTLTMIAALAVTQAYKTSVTTQRELERLVAVETQHRHEELSPTKSDLFISFVKEEKGIIGVISASRSYRLTAQPLTDDRQNAYVSTSFILPAH